MTFLTARRIPKHNQQLELLLRVQMVLITQGQIIKTGKSHDDSIHKRVKVIHIHWYQ